LEAIGGRTRADQRAGSDEAVIASEEAARKNEPDNVINIDGWMTYILGTPRTVQLVSARVRQIPKLEEGLISARALLGSISDAPFVTERTLLQFILQRQEVHVTVSGFLKVRIGPPKQVISPRASLYPSGSILWPSEFVLSKCIGAEADLSINRKNRTYLLVLQQSGDPDKMEIDVLLEIESLVESFLRTVKPGLRKSLPEWDLEKIPPERSLSPKRAIRECSRHRQEHGASIRSSRY